MLSARRLTARGARTHAAERVDSTIHVTRSPVRFARDSALIRKGREMDPAVRSTVVNACRYVLRAGTEATGRTGRDLIGSKNSISFVGAFGPM